MIVVDAGHGGEDPGASGNGIIEKDLNLAISNEMYEKFKEAGVPVKMTRTTDETLSPTERVKRVLDAFGNRKDVIVVSNHINAGGGDGAEVIYALRNTSTLSNLVLNELEKAGQNVRKAYQRRLPSDTSKDYYFMQRETGVTEPITVEYGFLDSTGDDVNQLKTNYKKYADAVVKAVLEYIGKSTGNTYVVQKGDSLWSVAKKFSVTVDQIKNANKLTSNLLAVGQKLIIPTKEVETPIGGNTYIVKSGDTLYSIANKYKTTVTNLIAINNLKNTALSVGQVLKITEITETPSTGDTYTVKSGDTLYSIANKYNTSVADLIALNNLSNASLSIGQVLKVKAGQTNEDIVSDYTNYTVKSGDTLYSIAKDFETSVDEIIGFNSLPNNILTIGQVLKIPLSGTGIVEEEKPLEYTEYVVKKGDNLYAISQKYNMSQEEIMNFNNLTSNLLNIGQVLKIPVTKEGIKYTVKSGDNLYSIASKYNTTVDVIKAKNNLTSNTLSIGQILYI